MKNFLVTETQYFNLRKYLIENKIRSYVFDWDDNILRMPTKIKLDKNVKGKWEPIEVSTEEFAHIRTNPEYRIKGDTFINFRIDDPFLVDVEQAIHHNSFAPSYKKFIEALTYANPFAINTARGHTPNALKEGVKMFINMVLSREEKEMMLQSIKKELPITLTKNLNNKQLLDLYLDEKGEFYPVSSAEFGSRFGLPVDNAAGANPEHSKKVAIEHFIKKLINGVKTHIINGNYDKISLGFSDDDIRNVKAVQTFIDDELNKLYPEVHFVVYDTSRGGNKKIVIEKE